MNRFLPYIGLGLLLLCFSVSLHRALTIQSGDDGGKVVIRIAHQLLMTGVRESIDEAATEYSRLHPDVVIKQIAIPIRSWPTWLRTQLIGETAPDITSLSDTNETMIARHYVILSDDVSAPNPYNRGTPLEGVAWRDTFVDGLASMYARSPNSGELPGVNLQLNTIRIFYNVDLLRTVTGSDKLPATYEELKALGPQIETYNRTHNTHLVPIAACQPYLPYLSGILTLTQTQKITRELSPLRTFAITPMDQARMILDGRLSYTGTPDIRSSLGLLHDVSTLMTPGFSSLSRDDALFAFMQQRALAICAGSWDYAAFKTEGAFEVGVARIPLPTTDDPVYGRYMIGSASEADGIPEAMFGITQYSRHPDVALDFLRFLSSYSFGVKLVQNTYRTSAIVGVPPPSAAPALAPHIDGELNGFSVAFPSYFANASLIYNRNLYRLLGPNGDPDDFLRVLQREIPAALRQDVALQLRRLHADIRRADTHIGLLLTMPPDTKTTQSVERYLQTQHLRQFDYILNSRPYPKAE